MSKDKILVVGEFEGTFFHELAKHGEVVTTKIDTDDTPLAEVTILVVRSKTKVNPTLVDRMPKLQCVITATHGTDHVNIDYLRERGIEFHNVPVQSYDVAQGVMAYIFAHSTNLLGGDRSTKRGEWKKKSLIGSRIKDKTLGIIGYGRIGREVARMASALEMKIMVYDPHVETIDYQAGTLDELLETADFITIHTPLTEMTRGLIGPREIAQMKESAYLINTARGGIIDEQALLAALRNGQIGGAALDVYEHQSPFHDETSWELIQASTVIATPHSIGQTREAIEEKGRGVINIIKEHVEHQERVA